MCDSSFVNRGPCVRARGESAWARSWGECGAVDALGHVDDRQRGDRHRDEGLHLGARAVGGALVGAEPGLSVQSASVSSIWAKPISEDAAAITKSTTSSFETHPLIVM